LHGSSIEILHHWFLRVFRQEPARNKWWLKLSPIWNGQGSLSWTGIREFLQLWDCLLNINLTDQEDCHTWRLDASRSYSSKSSYKAFFFGAVTFEPWQRIWKTWAPSKCKMFLWLAIQNRCWRADRLAKRGLYHPEKCPLCDQEEETILHLLTTCVIARQVWFKLLNPFNLADLVPQINERSFADWWRETISKVSEQHRKGVNTLITLGAWSIWKHRNACVFEGISPSVSTIWRELKTEHSLWCMAGAKKLLELGLALAD